MATRDGADPRESSGDRLLSLDEVARILDVSKRTIYRMIAGQELPEPVKVRSLSRMPESDVRAYMQRARRGRR